jgi:hypothetical protein
MSDAPQSTELFGQNPDPVKLLQEMDTMNTDQKKFNHLRTLFLEEADVDEYIQYLDTDEEIDLTRKQLMRLKGSLEGFKVYLKGYLEETSARIGRFDEKLIKGAEEFANPELTPEEVRKIFHIRERVAKAMQIAKEPRGEKGKSLREATQKGVADQAAKSELTPEQLEERVDAYKSQYGKLDADSKSRCSWEELRNRMTAKNGYYLRLAEALYGNGVLFGIDKEGNPLFADGGEEPIMTGMNYMNTRNRVLYKHKGSEMIRENGKPVFTGYEMFPYSGEYDKSPEIKMFEAATGKPFVKSPDGDEWRGLWLESGENPDLPRDADFDPSNGDVYVNFDNPLSYNPLLGVRRLLRVKKS